jgi:hypothetical protein
MPLAAVAVAAFFALIVLPRATLPMADGDAWWHIRAGEQILATGQVPDTNTWTIAGDGFRWISQDWLSNVGMAVLYGAGDWGVAYLSLAFAMATVIAFGILWLAIGVRAPSTGWLARLLFLTAGLIVAGPIIGIRVQTIDLPLAAATVWILWRSAAGRPWVALLLVPLALAWVNLHAGWVLLFLLGGAQLVGGLVDRWLRRGFAPQRVLPLGVALAGAAAALVVNPNGAEMYLYPFRTAAIGAHRVFLVEWSPPSLSSFEGQITIAFIAFVVAPTLVLGWRTMRTADVLWLAGLTVMALSAVRFAIFLGPIGAALAAVHLAPVIARTRVGATAGPRLERWSRPPRRSTERIVNGLLVAAVVLLGVGLAVSRAAPAAQAPAIGQSVPADAAAWLQAHRPDARIFNTYSWGGYLGRRLPDAKPYIDGRSDIYGDAVIRRYADTWNVTIDPADLLDEAGVDVVLLRPGAPLLDWVRDQEGWELTYEDPGAELWVRPPGLGQPRS